MAAQGYFLTEGDREALQTVIRLINEHGPQILSQPGKVQPDNQDITATTQCYIARTPYGGIPALTRAGDDEFRFRDRDQQWVYFNKADIPGKALCDVYRIVRSGDPLADYLTPLPGVAQWVFNLSDQAVPENSWIPVIRDKSGSWIFRQGSTGGGGSQDFSGLFAGFVADQPPVPPLTSVILTGSQWGVRYDHGGYSQLGEEFYFRVPEAGIYRVEFIFRFATNTPLANSGEVTTTVMQSNQAVLLQILDTMVAGARHMTQSGFCQVQLAEGLAYKLAITNGTDQDLYVEWPFGYYGAAEFYITRIRQGM